MVRTMATGAMATILATILAAMLAAEPATAQQSPGVEAPLAATGVPATGTVLDVTAEGRTARAPDLATIRAGVVTQAPGAAAALSDNAARMARVLAALRRAGVAPRDLATASIQLQPQYRYTEGQPPAITGYNASNTVSVRLRDIARSGSVLDALVAEGANQIDGPSLSIDNPDAALDEARADAVKRARARADLYARATGLTVARIVSISETGQDAGGPDRPPMMYAARMATTAPTQVAAGEKDVTVTLAVRFLLR